MKTPQGLIYAILITVTIVAVTLFARSQSSPLVATPAVHTPPPESATENPSAEAREDSGDKEASPKPQDAGAK